MSNVILPRLWTEQLRQDCTDAINLLMNSELIHPETHFAYIELRGKAVVHLFMMHEETGIPYADSFTTPVDLIVAAGTRALEESRSLQLNINRDDN